MLMVITAESALSLNGLTTFDVSIPSVYAPNVYLDKINNRVYNFIYLGDIDYDNYVTKYNEELLLPTLERSLIDYMRFYKIQDEGTMLWAMQDYLDDSRLDLDKLYEVAGFYKVPIEKVDYWVNEAKTEPYYSMG